MSARKIPYVPEKRIEEVRRKLSLFNLEKLGDVAGVSSYALNNFRRGQTIPPADVFLRVCDAIEYDLGTPGRGLVMDRLEQEIRAMGREAWAEINQERSLNNG